jgi:hypothetical protein
MSRSAAPALRVAAELPAFPMEQLTHPCPQCGTVLQYQAAMGEMPFKCPTCGNEAFLPPTPRAEDQIIKQQLDEAAQRLKEARKDRKRWRRVRIGLAVLCGCGWATMAVVTVALMGFVDVWLSRVWGWSGPAADTDFLAVIGMLLVLIDVCSLAGCRYCWQGPSSAGLRPSIKALLAVTVVRSLVWLTGGILLLASVLAPGTTPTRFVLGAAGILFFAEWVTRLMFLETVAHANSSAWLMRRMFNWLFMLVVTVIVAAVMLASFPPGGPAPSTGADWLGAMLLSFLGLLSAVMTWICFAWYLRLMHLLRAEIEI